MSAFYVYLHARRRLFQYQEAACAVEAEVPVGVGTIGKMRPDSRCHKFCHVVRQESVKTKSHVGNCESFRWLFFVCLFF